MIGGGHDRPTSDKNKILLLFSELSGDAEGNKALTGLEERASRPLSRSLECPGRGAARSVYICPGVHLSQCTSVRPAASRHAKIPAQTLSASSHTVLITLWVM